VTHRIGYEDFTFAVNKMSKALLLIKKMDFKASKGSKRRRKRTRKSSKAYDDSTVERKPSQSIRRASKLRKA
jgi:hypothetical protein